ncbi:teichuronic acid biosynthesis glycosyltransferase tuaH [Spirosoma pollinicola]|uniref:Teichuronic acid biosynthesis glycosyltransferase tuaH n=2 Tax=Spirosoma pollinicola TaxID=2057025 RepID=A0A2K8Z799_9BACT|nr:teichuronic acid biosynthesis glycosyltransferase tuaH [Spirosoma pollinicola]
MLKGHDIVGVGLLNWENDYTKSTMQLLSELSGDNQVLFVNYACTVKDIWQYFRKQKQIPLAQVIGYKDRLSCHQLDDGREVYVLIPPPMLPINQLRPGWLYNALLRWNTHRITKSTRRAMQRLGFKTPIVLNALHPTVGIGMAGKLSEKALVYYCYDAIEAETWSRAHGQVAEEQLLQQADAVITSSNSLYTSKRRLQPNCFLVENGVDIPLFRRANVSRINRESKTIGYIGSIDNRLDIDLLERCFHQFPDFRFLFVGRVPDPALAQRLGRFSNVMLAGSQPPSSLPEFLTKMDVGLIPFYLNEQTKAIYPLKINEYLAAGLPVVSTNFTDLTAFEPVVSISPSADEFIAAIEAALVETNPDLPKQRLLFAEANSWENRGRQFGEVLANVLAQKSTLSPNTVVPDYIV